MWNKELIEMLIFKYEQHENLYNVRDPGYLDRTKRSNALFEICEELKSVKKGITVEDIKKKIHTLRSQYIKELRANMDSKRNGVGADDVVEPKLWCFSQLQFLKSHCAIRKSVSDIPEADNSNISSLNSEESVEVENEPQPGGSKRKITNKLEERLENVKSLRVRKMEEMCDYDWLGKQVVFDMNRLQDASIKAETVWKIQNVIKEALMEDASKIQSMRQEVPNKFPTSTSHGSNSGFLQERPSFQSKASSFIRNENEPGSNHCSLHGFTHSFRRLLFGKFIAISQHSTKPLTITKSSFSSTFNNSTAISVTFNSSSVIVSFYKSHILRIK